VWSSDALLALHLLVGVDISPPPLEQEAVPRNLQFEVDDVNLGLKHFYNQFDFVHVRCIVLGIDNYRSMMEEAERCLKPGGLVMFMDGDIKILSQDQLHPVHFPVAGATGQVSWFRKIVQGMFNLYSPVLFQD
jgi:SAM-dependent methyltransferase